MLDAQVAYNKAVDAGARLSQFESIIAQNVKFAYSYANDVIGGRWPEAEPTIVKHLSHAFNYARFIIKGRWLEAEPMIAQNAEYAYWYARDVIQGRWLEAETVIAQDAEEACKYARDILKERFYEAEEIISKSDYVIGYIKNWFEEPVIPKSEVDEYVWLRSQAKGYFASKSLFENPVSSILDTLIEVSE